MVVMTNLPCLTPRRKSDNSLPGTLGNGVNGLVDAKSTISILAKLSQSRTAFGAVGHKKFALCGMRREK
jgi:hypothetical protein